MSLCTNQTKQWSATVRQTSYIIRLDQTASKALWLRSIAHQQTKQWDEAYADIKQAVRVDPKNKEIRDLYETIKKQHDDAKAKLKGGFGNFFREGNYKDKREAEPGHHNKLPQFNEQNVQCFQDITIGDKFEDPDSYKEGRVVFELFSEEIPRTCENFRVLCTGEKGDIYKYEGTCFFKAYDKMLIAGGDITNEDGEGGHSIYG